MPRIENQQLLEKLVAKLLSDPTATVESLNAAPKVGVSIGQVRSEQAIPALSQETITKIEDAAVSGAPSSEAQQAARNAAIGWLKNIDMGGIDMAEGSKGRGIVDALVTAGYMTAGEKDSLVSLASTDVYGQSWALQAGIGEVFPENLDQAREVAG